MKKLDQFERAKQCLDNILRPHVTSLLQTIAMLTGDTAESCKNIAKTYIDDCFFEDPEPTEISVLGKRSPSHEYEEQTNDSSTITSNNILAQGTSFNYHRQQFDKCASRSQAMSVEIDNDTDIKATKMFSLSAGSIKSFRQREYKTADSTEIIKAIENELRYRGSCEDKESEMLQCLNDCEKKNFVKNTKLYLCKNVNSTPDAVILAEGKVIAIAEFKNHSKMKAELLKAAKCTDNRQVIASMVACNATEGYLLTKLCNKIEIDQVKLSIGAQLKLNKSIKYFDDFKNDNKVKISKWKEIFNVQKKKLPGRPKNNSRHN